jgi:predicted RNA binding protein YcfA (HicA-like mRNA interferase family)
MSKLPMVNFKMMDKFLRHLGFAAVRQKGSHVFYRHPDGRATTLPNH